MIFDEGVPRDLLPLLREAGCAVEMFPRAWKGTKNGKLLALIEQAGIHCLITSDKNLQFQQNLSKRPFAVVVLPSPRLEELLHLVRRIADAVADSEPGKSLVIEP